jgi:hypothetical protein
MRSTGGRKYRASRFLGSRCGEPLTPVRDLWRLSREPLMDQPLQPEARDPRLLSRRAARSLSKRL